jgi:hypothetical protein
MTPVPEYAEAAVCNWENFMKVRTNTNTET